MAHYLVIKPCKYISGGAPYYHRAGEVVELDDQVAAFLVRHIKAHNSPEEILKGKYGALVSYVVDPAATDHASPETEIDLSLEPDDNKTMKKGES
jgi:hypothetical protein